MKGNVSAHSLPPKLDLNQKLRIVLGLFCDFFSYHLIQSPIFQTWPSNSDMVNYYFKLQNM